MFSQSKRDFLFKKAPAAAVSAVVGGLVGLLGNKEASAEPKPKRNWLREVSSINHTTALTNNFQTSNVRGQKQFVLEEYLKDPFTYSANSGGIILGTKDKQSDRYSIENPSIDHVRRILKRPDLAHVAGLVKKGELLIPEYKHICDIVSLMKDNCNDNLLDNENLKTMENMHYDFINASLSPEEMKEIYSMIGLEVGKSAIIPFKILKTNPEKEFQNEWVYALMEIKNEGLEAIQKPKDPNEYDLNVPNDLDRFVKDNPDLNIALVTLYRDYKKPFYSDGGKKPATHNSGSTGSWFDKNNASSISYGIKNHVQLFSGVHLPEVLSKTDQTIDAINKKMDDAIEKRVKKGQAKNNQYWDDFASQEYHQIGEMEAKRIIVQAMGGIYDGMELFKPDGRPGKDHGWFEKTPTFFLQGYLKGSPVNEDPLLSPKYHNLREDSDFKLFSVIGSKVIKK